MAAALGILLVNLFRTLATPSAKNQILTPVVRHKTVFFSFIDLYCIILFLGYKLITYVIFYIIFTPIKLVYSLPNRVSDDAFLDLDSGS
jgi:hypothetical protein